MSFTGNKADARMKGDTSSLAPTGAWESTHKATVNGILLPADKRVPAVTVSGTGFYYAAWWPTRKLISNMCDWALRNPGCVPTRDDVELWVNTANFKDWNEEEHQERLNVAVLGQEASRRTIQAVVGGACHESLHKMYTCQRTLSVDEVFDTVVPRWAKIEDVAKWKKLLLDAANIAEDIRIERMGCATLPGIRNKMADLQDFILSMEAKGRETGHDGGELWVVLGAFRDIGLGYRTQLQRDALEVYKTRSDDAYRMVVDGPVTQILKDCIPCVATKDDVKREAADVMSSVRTALDLVVAIFEEGHGPDEDDGEGEGEGKGPGGRACCPKCSAPARALRARPVAAKPDKIAITCTLCGWQEVIDKPEAGQDGGGQGGGTSVEFPGAEGGSGGSGAPSDPTDTIRWDGDEEIEQEASDEDGEGKGDDEDGDEDGDDSDDSSSDGKGDEDGDDSDDDDSDGASSASSDSDEDESSEDDDSSEDESSEAGPEGGSSPVGGGAADTDNGDFQTVAELIKDAVENGTDHGLLDYASALGDKAEDDRKKEENTVRKDEALWRPADTSGDKVVVPRVNDGARTAGKQITKSVRRECAYMIARLRQIVMGAADLEVDDGTRRGKALSSRYLTDTFSTLAAGKTPRRAFRSTEEQEVPSTAAAVVVDESGSMCGILAEAGQVAAALAMPLDSLGCAVQVSGIRSGSWGTGNGGVEGAHRDYSVNYDVIKGYDEPYRQAEPRFSLLRATGGTPLADGIEFALRGILDRDEDNRIVFVITDGCPDWGNEPVIRRQIRIAQENGIHVVGIGIGSGASYVKNLFPDHVWAPRVTELPRLLVKKLNDLMVRKGRKAA